MTRYERLFGRHGLPTTRHCPVMRKADIMGKCAVSAAMTMVLAKPKRQRVLRPCELRIDREMPGANQLLRMRWL